LEAGHTISGDLGKSKGRSQMSTGTIGGAREKPGKRKGQGVLCGEKGVTRRKTKGGRPKSRVGTNSSVTMEPQGGKEKKVCVVGQ